MRVRFLSRNPHKIAEAQAILVPLGVTVVPVRVEIDERQTDDIEKLVRQKAIEAIHQIGHPIFVEQTGLYLASLNGFPGGLTQVFWDTLEADRVAHLYGSDEVSARTRIGYCDGRRIHQFEGELSGRIAPEPRGDRAFQWDCVFIPDGETETFAQMGPIRKNAISMRRRALEALALHLQAAAR
jgi:XTP/dITP diphosphohydrolase